MDSNFSAGCRENLLLTISAAPLILIRFTVRSYTIKSFWIFVLITGLCRGLATSIPLMKKDGLNAESAISNEIFSMGHGSTALKKQNMACGFGWMKSQMSEFTEQQ